MLLFRAGAFVCALMFCGLAAGNARAEVRPEEAPDFTKHVLPIFEAKCIRCHGAQRRGGKLDMRTLESMLTGGVSGPAFKPGNSKKSLLIELIHYNEMPPKKESPRVTKEELELLRKWIDARPAQNDSTSRDSAFLSRRSQIVRHWRFKSRNFKTYAAGYCDEAGTCLI